MCPVAGIWYTLWYIYRYPQDVARLYMWWFGYVSEKNCSGSKMRMNIQCRMKVWRLCMFRVPCARLGALVKKLAHLLPSVVLGPKKHSSPIDRIACPPRSLEVRGNALTVTGNAWLPRGGEGVHSFSYRHYADFRLAGATSKYSRSWNMPRATRKYSRSWNMTLSSEPTSSSLCLLTLRWPASLC